MNNQTNSTTKIINDSIDKNMDTFLKWIEFAHKFYYDIVQSYYDYVVKINKSPDRESYYWLTINLVYNCLKALFRILSKLVERL